MRLKKTFEEITIFDNPDFLSWVEQVEKINPSLLIIDSIQTVFDSTFPGSAGSIIQVKETALKLIRLAKRLSLATFLVGHVTKEGEVAGPKTLEHLVDAVFYLEGEKSGRERYLKAHKNRFGPTDEMGLFSIDEEGLKNIDDFGRIKAQRELSVGVARTAVLEGTRVYFTEVQSLVQKAPYGFPKRNSVGFDQNRLQMILAILARHTQVDLSLYDVFLNIPDGYKLKSPIGDLAVLAALTSSFLNKPLKGSLLLIGEVDLAGRMHLPGISQKIIKAAVKLGYKMPVLKGRDLKEIVRGFFDF